VVGLNAILHIATALAATCDGILDLIRSGSIRLLPDVRARDTRGVKTAVPATDLL
jgi:hypothetical protein